MKGDKGFGLQATLDHLERIRTVATMEHMSIDVTQRTIDIYINGKPLPNEPRRVSNFVRNETRVYRETWLLPPIDNLIADVKRKMARRDALKKGRQR
jgi:hypothetical protein